MKQRGFKFDGLTDTLSLPNEKRRPTIEERWADFLRAHPWFMDRVIDLSRERLDQGNKRWSMKAVFEILRPQFRRGESFGLNNSFTALAAREAVRRAPDLESFFEFR